MEESPFIKQLVTSDRKIRESALGSLRTYLSNKQEFPAIELLKLHKALFFSMWHQDRPIPQQNLASSLADLSLSIPNRLFIPYTTAFWQTMAREWTNIDALRMDKFLRLTRVHVGAGFQWLQRQKWSEPAVKEYIDMIESWPLSPPFENQKVGDGMRYHVLDVWVDELEKIDGETKEAPVQDLMAPPRNLVKQAKTKALRNRARECAEDERLGEWLADSNAASVGSGQHTENGAGGGGGYEDGDAEEEFQGIDSD